MRCFDDSMDPWRPHHRDVAIPVVRSEEAGRQAQAKNDIEARVAATAGTRIQRVAIGSTVETNHEDGGAERSDYFEGLQRRGDPMRPILCFVLLQLPS